MKKLRVLHSILKKTKSYEMLFTYLIFLFVSAAIINVAEPDIHTIREALWYEYAVLTTVGFGDVIVTTFIGKTMSVLVSIYSIIIIGIITGVIVNYYGQIIEIQQKDTIAAFLDRLEHLPEMTEEELKEMSENIKKFKEER